MNETDESLSAAAWDTDVPPSSSTALALLDILKQQTELLRSQEAAIKQQEANQALILEQLKTLTMHAEKGAEAPKRYSDTAIQR